VIRNERLWICELTNYYIIFIIILCINTDCVVFLRAAEARRMASVTVTCSTRQHAADARIATGQLRNVMRHARHLRHRHHLPSVATLPVSCLLLITVRGRDDGSILFSIVAKSFCLCFSLLTWWLMPWTTTLSLMKFCTST